MTVEASYDSALQKMSHRGCAIYLSKGAGLQCFFRRTASRPGCLSACIHFFILALTGSKSGAKRGWRGKGAPRENSEWCREEQFVAGDLWYFAKKAGLLLLRAAFFLSLLFTNRAVHLGVKRLIAIGFSQSCTVFYQPGKEGRAREAVKKEKN